jgi:hypothetical protein
MTLQRPRALTDRRDDLAGSMNKGLSATILTLSQLMLNICSVSKTFGEWYQKTNKTEDTNK